MEARIPQCLIKLNNTDNLNLIRMKSNDALKWMCQNGYMDNAYTRACEEMNLDVLKVLIDNGFIGTTYFYTELFDHTFINNVTLLKFLIANDGNIGCDIIGPHLNRILRYPSQSKRTIAMFLLDCGALRDDQYNIRDCQRVPELYNYLVKNLHSRGEIEALQNHSVEITEVNFWRQVDGFLHDTVFVEDESNTYIPGSTGLNLTNWFRIGDFSQIIGSYEDVLDAYNRENSR